MPGETIDLHGLSVDVAMQTFIERCNQLFSGGYRGTIAVVHGYGSSGQGGAIKERLKSFLVKHADYFDAPAWDGGNPGVTAIRQLKLLPAEHAGGVHEQIIVFLQAPKTEAKILAKFHARPVAEIKGLLRELRGRGLICEINKSGQRAWQSVSGDGRQ
jgi:hypothetical protein